jgi:hypothetical protein
MPYMAVGASLFARRAKTAFTMFDSERLYESERDQPHFVLYHRSGLPDVLWHTSGHVAVRGLHPKGAPQPKQKTDLWSGIIYGRELRQTPALG